MDKQSTQKTFSQLTVFLVDLAGLSTVQQQVSHPINNRPLDLWLTSVHGTHVEY